MLKPYARQYMELGRELTNFETVLTVAEGYGKDDPDHELRPEERAQALVVLAGLIGTCQQLNMPVSLGLLEGIAADLPQTARELALIVRAVIAELDSKQFLFIPEERAKYHDIILQSLITSRFPNASKELVAAGNCFATSNYTACVFHSMRAAEIGVRVFGADLGVEFPDKPIELAEWQNILDQADSKIIAMKGLQRGTHKDKELKFYSQAAVQFRYFKDAWRVRVAHARETYEEIPARRVFEHTLEFFETLSKREPPMKEPSFSA